MANTYFGPIIAASTDTAKPAPRFAGDMCITADTKKIYVSTDGSTWGVDGHRNSIPSDIACYNWFMTANGTQKTNGINGCSLDGGTETDASDSERPSNKFVQNVNAGVTGYRSTTAGLKGAMSPVMAADFKIQSTTHMYFQAGFQSGAAAGTRGTAGQQALLDWMSGTDTNFLFRTVTGGSATTTNTGVAKDGNWHRVKIWSPDAGVTYICELDGAIVAVHTGTVPVTTTGMYAMCCYGCHSSGSTTNEMRSSVLTSWVGGRP